MSILKSPLEFWFAATLTLTLLPLFPARGLEGGTNVVVVYNTKVPESKEVADYYARQRAVPTNQVFGFSLSAEEAISRADYLSQLEKPLLDRLTTQRLLTFSPATNKSPNGPLFAKVTGSRIRYLVLCYGVPVRILRDANLKEPPSSSLPAPLADRNEAAVDAQLAIAPISSQGFPWAGPLQNPFLGTTNGPLMNPANGLLMVARLDGPSASVARGLVDKAMEAETNGLWGRAYFDARGLATNDAYYPGDEMMKAAADSSRRLGFETVLDERAETFSPVYPMSQIAFYAGWYDQVVSGPFTRPTVEFMPGAFAYHLYSFNASSIRSTNSWVGTLLAKGATCTMGSVDEPLLAGTPDMAIFFPRFTRLGFTFGEAAYACQPSMSWQTTVIGDPLFCPFGRSPDELLAGLQARSSPLLEWYYLVAINQQLANGADPRGAIKAILSLPTRGKSAVLTEKMADLFWSLGSMSDAIDTYEAALRRGPSPVQRRRLLLQAAEKRNLAGPDETALAHYNTFLRENPDYPERLKIYQAMLPIAQRRVSMTGDVARIEQEIKRLTPP